MTKEKVQIPRYNYWYYYDEEFTELINSIGNSEISDDIKIDKDFEEKLRDYQKEGYKWLKTLEKYIKIQI